MEANANLFRLTIFLIVNLSTLNAFAQPYMPQYGNRNNSMQNGRPGMPGLPNSPSYPGNQPGYAPYQPGSPYQQNPNGFNPNYPYSNQPIPFEQSGYPSRPSQTPSNPAGTTPYPGLDNPFNNSSQSFYRKYHPSYNDQRVRLTPNELNFIQNQRPDLLNDVRGSGYSVDISLRAYESLYGKTLQQMTHENKSYRNSIVSNYQYYQRQRAIIYNFCNPDIINRLFSQGVELFNEGKLKSALDKFHQAEKVSKCLKNYLIDTNYSIDTNYQDQVAEENLFEYLGKIHETLKNKDQAIKYFRFRLNIVRKLKDIEGELETLRRLGVIYQSLKNYDAAINYHNQAIVLAKKINNLSQENAISDDLGDIYSQLGYLNQAVSYYQRQLVISAEVEPDKKIDILGKISLLYRLLNNYVEAVDYQSRQLKEAQLTSDSVAEVKAYSGLGITYTYLGDYDKALEMHQMAIDLARKINDRLLESISLDYQGKTYNLMGEYEKAIESHQKNLAISRQIKNRQQQEITLGNLGNIYDILGKHNQAFKLHYQSLIIAQEAKDLPGQVTALNNLGRSSIYLKKYSQGITYLQKAVQISRQIQDQWEEGTALNQLGIALYKLGRFSDSEKMLRRGMSIWENIRAKLGDREKWKVSIFETQLSTYSLLQKTLVAQDKFKEALEISERGRARIFIESLSRRFKDSRLKQKLIQPPSWQQIQQTAIARNATIIEYSIIYDELKSPGKQLRPEAEIYIWVIKPNGEAFFRQANLKSLRQQGITVSSLTTVSRSAKVGVNFFQSIVQKSWIRSLQEEPNLLIAGLLGLGVLGFLFIRIGYAYLFNKKQYLQLQNNHSKKQKYGSRKSIIYYQEKRRIVGIKPVLLGLGLIGIFSGSAYLILAKQSQILPLALTNTKLSSQRGLILVPKGTQAVSTSNSSSDLQAQLAQLYKLLIQPIEDILPTDPDAQIIFVPQDSLYLVPFAALKDKTDRYLIEKHTISLSPSIQTLNLTDQRQKELKATSLQSFLQRKDVLIVGNPVMPQLPTIGGVQSEPLEPLPSAEKEANEIANILNAKALIGKEAKKITVINQMPNARVIHLATHGLLDDRRGTNSAIALTASNQDNGLLTAEEIQDMQLKAELVVLSACDTGRGKITGDGVIGLSRSLLFAGVPSVVVSLWAIPDTPTSELMIEFYRNLQITTKAKALRQAMLTTMRKHPNPRDWAAFTIIGEAE